MAGEAISPIPNNTGGASTAANIQPWINILEQLFPGATNTNTSGASSTQSSSAADGGLQAMIAMLTGQLQSGMNGGFNNLLAPIFQQFKEGALPGIQGQANAGGGVFNSSTQKLLQGDALARATAQGGAVIATQQNAVQAQIANLLATLAKSTAATNVATQSAQTQQKSGQGSNALKAAGAAAAGSGLAKLVDALTKRDAQSAEQSKAGGEEENNLGSGKSDSSGASQGASVEDAEGGAVPFDTGNDDPGASASFAEFGLPDGLDLSFLGDIGNNGDNGLDSSSWDSGNDGGFDAGGGDGGFSVDDSSIFGGEGE